MYVAKIPSSENYGLAGCRFFTRTDTEGAKRRRESTHSKLIPRLFGCPWLFGGKWMLKDPLKMVIVDHMAHIHVYIYIYIDR